MVGTFIWPQAVHSARKPPGEPTTHPGSTSSGSRGWLGVVLSCCNPKVSGLLLQGSAALVGCPSETPKDHAARFALLNPKDFLGLRASFLPDSEPPSFQGCLWHSSRISPDFISRVLQGEACSMRRPFDLCLRSLCSEKLRIMSGDCPQGVGVVWLPGWCLRLVRPALGRQGAAWPIEQRVFSWGLKLS